jgi:hypothetical protein
VVRPPPIPEHLRKNRWKNGPSELALRFAEGAVFESYKYKGPLALVETVVGLSQILKNGLVVFSEHEWH